ncbi:MAG: hypothetical protein U1C58_06160 [Flavobacteriaceae bacterium]|nr:hypothetical protein [Flavobacteriaceae bacterium]MDZ4147848.1 hypothetical protein [Flavobacteriaceae bacterium]
MKLKTIVSTNCGSRDAALSVSKAGCVSVSMTAVQKYRLHKVISTSILQDADSPKDFYVQFFEDESGNFKARYYQSRLQFNCADIYRAMKDAFGLRKSCVLQDYPGGLKARPLLINLSELL